MVDVTAKQRLERAAAFTSRAAGESKGFKQADQIEIYRRGISKDEAGWRGPATYLDQYGGQHSIRWQGSHLSVSTQEIHTAITHTTFLTHDEHRWPHGSSPFSLLSSFGGRLAKRVHATRLALS